MYICLNRHYEFVKFAPAAEYCFISFYDERQKSLTFIFRWASSMPHGPRFRHRSLGMSMFYLYDTSPKRNWGLSGESAFAASRLLRLQYFSLICTRLGPDNYRRTVWH